MNILLSFLLICLTGQAVRSKDLEPQAQDDLFIGSASSQDNPGNTDKESLRSVLQMTEEVPEPDIDMEEEDQRFDCHVNEPLGPRRRTGYDTRASKWQDSTVIYEFNDSFESLDREIFDVAVGQIEECTCVRFKKKSEVGGNDYQGPLVEVRRGSTCTKKRCGCGGNVDILGANNRYSKKSHLTINSCKFDLNNQWGINLVVHELLHVLGLVHTQKRRDRDQTIRVRFDNIERKPHPLYPWRDTNKYQFEQCYQCETYGTEYDCKSIMHYESCSMSINVGRCLATQGKEYATMEPVDKNSKCTIADLYSTNLWLTESDVTLINAMYCENQPIPSSCNSVFARSSSPAAASINGLMDSLGPFQPSCIKPHDSILCNWFF